MLMMTFSDLRRSMVDATDGSMGAPSDILYRDDDWRIVYIVVDVGSLLFSRKILLGSHLLGAPDVKEMALPVDLSRDEVSEAPELESDPPVGEQRTSAELPSYFLSSPDGGYSPYLAELFVAQAAQRRERGEEPQEGDPHLRSMHEALGYRIAATDGEIGTVDDFLIDPETWKVVYFTVDTGNWLPGKRVVLAVDWIRAISWSEGVVKVPFNIEKIEESPDVSSLKTVARADMQPLHHYFGYPMI